MFPGSGTGLVSGDLARGEVGLGGGDEGFGGGDEGLGGGTEDVAAGGLTGEVFSITESSSARSASLNSEEKE